MKTISNFFKMALLGLMAIAVLSCSDDDDGSSPTQKISIAAVVEASSEFSLLEMALKDTGLFSTFEAEGMFTVFAPTDTAFEAALAELNVAYTDLTVENLTRILQMHVLSNEVASTDLTDGITPATLLGENITINLDPVRITDPRGRVSNIGLTDLEASNGIIHVIDNVILPESLVAAQP